MILRWFDTAEVTAFAKSTAEEYARLRKSVAVRHDTGDKRAQKFEKLARKVEDFHRANKLNVYKKAKLLNELRYELRSRSVPEPDIAAFVNSLLLSPLS